jgi:hypothetical protein
MGRLIDADAFIKDVCSNCDGWCDCVKCDCLNCKSEHRCDFIQQVHEQPTVDAVPVKWIQSYVKRLEENGNTFAAVQYEMMIDDYRADGERRSE